MINEFNDKILMIYVNSQGLKSYLGQEHVTVSPDSFYYTSASYKCPARSHQRNGQILLHTPSWCQPAAMPIPYGHRRFPHAVQDAPPLRQKMKLRGASELRIGEGI